MINPAPMIFEKNHWSQQGEQNLGVAKFCRRKQINPVSNKDYLAVLSLERGYF
jgi:hypothetical protein